MNTIKILNSAFKIPVDSGRQVDCVRHYTDGRYSASMFSFGTWAFARGDAGFDNAAQRLANFSDVRNFRVREMDDGNYVVGFGEDFFAVVLREELENIRAEVSQEIDSFAEGGEDILTPHDTPRDHLFVGLLARSRLTRDVGSPSVVAQFRADRK